MSVNNAPLQGVASGGAAITASIRSRGNSFIAI